MVYPFLSDEWNILQWISDCSEDECLYLGGNSFCRRIVHVIQKEQDLEKNNGHNRQPPDFFSKKMNLMFDVMRINDTEERKHYNPLLIEETKRIKEINNHLEVSSIRKIPITIFLKEDKDSRYFDHHKYVYYKRQGIRVIKQHLKKIDIWREQHPDILHKGIVICDEAGLYFNGTAIPVGVKNDILQYQFIPFPPLTIHEPWLDIDFVEPLLNAKIDFVVWFMPYKRHSTVGSSMNHKYPTLVICDLRFFCRTNLKRYNCDSMIPSG